MPRGVSEIGRRLRTLRPLLPHLANPDWMLVPLSRGLFATIDLVDAAAVGQHNWSARKDSNSDALFYAETNIKLTRGVYRTCSLHKFIGNLLGFDQNLEVDHKDRDGLMCVRLNLRPGTRSQNMSNQGIAKDSATGFKGVSRYGDRFRAYGCKNHKHVHIGYFKSVVDAAKAYNDYAIKNYGEFSRLNVIPTV